MSKKPKIESNALKANPVIYVKVPAGLFVNQIIPLLSVESQVGILSLNGDLSQQQTIKSGDLAKATVTTKEGVTTITVLAQDQFIKSVGDTTSLTLSVDAAGKLTGVAKTTVTQIDWANVQNKPTSYPSTINLVDGLQAALNNLAQAIGQKAAASVVVDNISVDTATMTKTVDGEKIKLSAIGGAAAASLLSYSCPGFSMGSSNAASAKSIVFKGITLKVCNITSGDTVNAIFDGSPNMNKVTAFLSLINSGTAKAMALGATVTITAIDSEGTATTIVNAQQIAGTDVAIAGSAGREFAITANIPPQTHPYQILVSHVVTYTNGQICATSSNAILTLEVANAKKR